MTENYTKEKDKKKLTKNENDNIIGYVS